VEPVAGVAAGEAFPPKGGGSFRASAALLAGAVLILTFLPLLRGWHAVPFHLLAPPFTGGNPAAARDLPPALRHLPGDDPTGVLLDYPGALHTARRLRRGEVPWWNPLAGTGRAWIGNGQVFPFSPFLLPFVAAPSPHTYSLGLVLLALYSLFFAHAFFREGGMAQPAAVLGALLWTFSPFACTTWSMSSVWAFWCFPAAALGALRALRTQSLLAWAFTGAALALASLSGQPETALLLALGVPLLFLFHPFAPRSRRGWLGLALSAFAAVLLSAPQWAPLLDTALRYSSYKGAGLARALELAHSPSSFFDPSSSVFLPPFLWAGALLAFTRRPLRWEVKAAAAGSLLCLLQSVPLLNATLPLRLIRLGGLIPPLHADELAVVPLSVLAAFGFAEILPGEEGGRAGAAWRRGALLLWTALTLWALLRRAQVPGAPRLGLLWLGGLLLIGAALLGPKVPLRRRGPLLSALALGGALLPTALAGFRYPGFSPAASPRWALPPGEAQSGPAPPTRFWAPSSPRTGAPLLTPNLNLLSDLPDLRTASVFHPPGALPLAHAFGPGGHLGHLFLGWPAAPKELLSFLNVGWVLVPGEGGEVRALRLEPGPRAFLCTDVLAVSREEEALKAFKRLLAEGNLHRTAVVLGAPPFPAEGREPLPPGAALRWLRYDPERLEVEASAPGPAFLVLLDAFDPRWKAEVDGRPAPLYRTDVAFRGISLPAGAHRVVLRFEPALGRWGITAGAAAWGLLLGWALWTRRRRRRGSPPPLRGAAVPPDRGSGPAPRGPGPGPAGPPAGPP